MSEKYYSVDFSISIVDVKAKSKQEVEDIMNEFVDKIGSVMADQLCWDECDWTIEENVLDEKEGVWNTQ